MMHGANMQNVLVTCLNTEKTKESTSRLQTHFMPTKKVMNIFTYKKRFQTPPLNDE